MIELILKFPFFLKDAIPELVQPGKVKQAFYVLALGVTSGFISAQIIAGRAQTPSGIFLSVLFCVIVAALLWIMNAAVLHVLAALTGGKGDVLTLLAATGFSCIPLLLLLPVSQLILFLNRAPVPAYRAVCMIICVWVFMLIARSLKQIYSMRTIHSLVLMLTPFYIIPALIVTGILVFIVIIFSSIPIHTMVNLIR
jgi:hypothetical protein